MTVLKHGWDYDVSGRPESGVIRDLFMPASARSSLGRSARSSLCRSCSEEEDGLSTLYEFDSDDPLHEEYETLDEDTYGMGIAAIIKDSYWIVHGQGPTAARVLQFLSAIALIVFTVGLQGYFIWHLGELVTAPAVTHARHIYEQYEVAMYAPGHLYNNTAGHLRGVDGPKGPYFRPENFDDLPKDLKDSACAIPFSQPGFFAAVLIIWTLTVVNNLKRVTELMYHFIWITPTVSSVTQMMKQDDHNHTIVKGVTCPIKCVLITLVGIPRILMNTVLLWNGSRYLAATFSFADLLLNAIALEFILLLKDLLWTVVISDRNKREVANMRYFARERVGRVSGFNYLESWFWLLLSILYVGMYFNFQQTLPQYNWDVRDVCKDYLEWKARG
jgi:hypothetical protein